jgi:hypothetical protein
MLDDILTPQSRELREWEKEKNEKLSVAKKGKGEVVPVFLTEHHAMKTYWGSGGIAPRILWPQH